MKKKGEVEGGRGWDRKEKERGRKGRKVKREEEREDRGKERVGVERQRE